MTFGCFQSTPYVQRRLGGDIIYNVPIHSYQFIYNLTEFQIIVLLGINGIESSVISRTCRITCNEEEDSATD